MYHGRTEVVQYLAWYYHGMILRAPLRGERYKQIREREKKTIERGKRGRGWERERIERGTLEGRVGWRNIQREVMYSSICNESDNIYTERIDVFEKDTWGSTKPPKWKVKDKWGNEWNIAKQRQRGNVCASFWRRQRDQGWFKDNNMNGFCDEHSVERLSCLWTYQDSLSWQLFAWYFTRSWRQRVCIFLWKKKKRTRAIFPKYYILLQSCVEVMLRK